METPVTIRTLHRATDENPLLAYYDTIASDLVPVKILEYYVDDWDKREYCRFRVTASRKGYPRGLITSAPLRHIVSRRTFQRGYHIFVHTANHDAARRALAG